MAFDIELLKKLTEAFGPSGRENEVANVIIDHVSSHKLQHKKDINGNIYVTLGEGGKKIIVAAHMDEIGVVVNYIDKKGFLKVSPVGFVYSEQLMGNRVLFENKKWGVFYFEKTYPRVKTDFEKAFVDIGAKDREDADNIVPVGTFGVFHRELLELDNDRIASKALDDRVGCYVLLKAIEKLKGKKLSNTVNFVFTVQEEFSGLGASTSAYALSPDLGIAVDVTDSDDTREKCYVNMVLDSGPAIKVMDASLISHPALKNYFIDICKSKKIPYQLEVLPFGGTDAGTFAISREGIPSICISIPTRYIHTNSEVISKSDVENTINLLTNGLQDTKLGKVV